MTTYSIIQKSQLEGALRLDAEYYQPEYLELENKIKGVKFATIKDLSEKVFSGPFGSTLKSESYRDSGIPFIRIGDIADIFVDKDRLVYISEEEHKRIYSTHLNIGDIVLSKIATVGRLSVIDDGIGEINISENNIGIRLQNLDENIRAYVLFFLLSRFGQSQILRRASGNIQLKLNVSDVESITLPITKNNQNKIFADYYSQIMRERRISIDFYQQAENVLLEELGLKNFDEEENLSSVVNLSEIKLAKRMDAEYFQLKYEKITSLIRANSGIRLGELVSIKKGFEPGSEAYQEDGKLFIRVSSLSRDGIIDKDQKYLSNDLYQKLKNDFGPKVGEILLTKDATPGIAYLIKEPIEGIIAGGILKLKMKKDIDFEYLTLCINSIIGRMQAKRDSGGSVIAHWKPEQVKNLLIPILPKSTQQKIADLVRKSHEARKKAKELLEQAKQEVEEMIEK